MDVEGGCGRDRHRDGPDITRTGVDPGVASPGDGAARCDISGSWRKARATRRSSERDDGQALGELEARPLALPAGLEVEWLGVSGYRLSYEGQTLFIDPYLSRVPFRDLLLRRPALPDPAALDRFVQRARARSSACSSATPTSTTPSTRRRSPGASAARPTARTRWST